MTPQIAKKSMFKRSKHYTLMTETSRPKESLTSDFNFDIRNLLLSPSPKRTNLADPILSQVNSPAVKTEVMNSPVFTAAVSPVLTQ